MEQQVLEGRDYRLMLSVCAAMGAIAICLAQRHVHVVLSEPGTYLSPLQHRCGLLMIGCLLWAAAEWLALLSMPSVRSTDPRY